MVWVISLVMRPYRKIREELAWRKRLKDLKDKDPFVYEDRE